MCNIKLNEAKRKREPAENFIGWKSEDGNLEVVEIHEKIKGQGAKYRVVCKICSQNTELFPLGYFVSTKGHLESGRKPCGCSKKHNWDSRQYLVLIKGIVKDSVIIHGLAEKFQGHKTKIDCECPIDGHKWTPTISRMISSSSGCSVCYRKAQKERQKTPEPEALQRCKEICDEVGYDVIGFPSGYKNARSIFEYKCSKHGTQNVRYASFVNKGTRCPHCAEYGYNPIKSGSFYIVKWSKDDHSFIKFGKTNQEVLSRIKTQAGKTDYNYEIILQFTWKDGHIAQDIEKAIKFSKMFETKVVSKIDFADGYTETINSEELDNVCTYVYAWLNNNNIEYDKHI